MLINYNKSVSAARNMERVIYVSLFKKRILQIKARGFSFQSLKRVLSSRKYSMF